MEEIEFRNVLSKSQGSRLTRTEPKSISKFLALSTPARLPSGCVLEVQCTFKELVIKCNACMRARLLSCVQLCVSPWAVVCQAPPSMGFSRQEDWNEVPLPSPIRGDKEQIKRRRKDSGKEDITSVALKTEGRGRKEL